MFKVTDGGIKSHDYEEVQKLIGISLLLSFLGLVVLFFDYIGTQKSFDGKIERPKAGEGSVTKSLLLTRDGSTLVRDVTISEMEYEGQMVERLFYGAVAEIESTVLGENKSQDYVTSNLNLSDVYMDGLIKASWKLSDYSYMNSSGKIRFAEVPKDGAVVTVSGVLSYSEYEYLYEFNVHIWPPDLSSEEGFLLALDETLEYCDEQTRTRADFSLPLNVAGQVVGWKQPMDYRGLQLFFLGIVSATAIYLSRGQMERQKQREIENYLLLDYPEIVSNLSILLGAGISFKGAIGRMVAHYSFEKEQGLCGVRPGMEELSILNRELSDGVGELTAIENMGRRLKVKEYRKLTMLLTQNLKKGSRDLIDMLEKEDALAFELKKQRALKQGEEASTKMLLPMGGMLLIVIVILVLPAVMQMNV